MIEQLLTLKQKQIEAFHQEQWDEVSKLEEQVQDMMSQMTLTPNSLNEHHQKLIHKFVELHKQILELAMQNQDENIKEMLTFQKSKLAAKAYSNK